MKKYLKNTLKIYIYNFKNSLTGLVVEPVKSAVKANISIEADQFCLHQLFSKKLLYLEILKNNLLFIKYTNFITNCI